MSRTQVVIDSRFAEFERDLEAAVGAGLERAARHGAEMAARTTPLRGYRVQGIIGNYTVSSATRGRRGLEVSIAWRDFRARFFEQGTYLRKGAAKSARTRAAHAAAGGGHRGVRPLRFMRRAKREAQAVVVDMIRSEMR